MNGIYNGLPATSTDPIQVSITVLAVFEQNDTVLAGKSEIWQNVGAKINDSLLNYIVARKQTS